MRARFAVLLSALFFAACDRGNSPNGPEVYDVGPAAKMAVPDTTAPAVLISDSTPAGDVRMDGKGRLDAGILVLDAGGIKLRYASPCTLKVACADGSEAVSARGLSPVSDTTDTLWFWGNWDACPANTADDPQAVNLTVSVVDLAGNVGSASRMLVQPVYVAPDPQQLEPQPQAVLASYALAPESPAVSVSDVAEAEIFSVESSAATCETCGSSPAATGNAGVPGTGFGGITTVVSGERPTLTNEFMFVWGYFTLNGNPAPVGTVVTAVGDDGRVVGYFETTTRGAYGAMAVYGNSADTVEDDGANQGETISLLVDGEPTGSTFTWTWFGDVLRLDLDISPEQSTPSAEPTLTFPALRTGEVTGAPGEMVYVPVMAENFVNVGAFTIVVSYDDSVLAYEGNVGPGGIEFLDNAVNGEVRIAWFDQTAVTPLSAPDGTLLTLSFKVIGDPGTSSPLVFTHETELADAEANPLTDAVFEDGSVTVVPGEQEDDESGSVIDTWTWWMRMEVSNAAGHLATLWFGQAPGATDGVDWELGEERMPPLPPLGAFDARFLGLGGDSPIPDLRSADDLSVAWEIQVTPGDVGYPVTITWDPSDLPEAGSFWLLGADSGPVDMRAAGSATILANGRIFINYNYNNK